MQDLNAMLANAIPAWKLLKSAADQGAVAARAKGKQMAEAVVEFVPDPATASNGDDPRPAFVDGFGNLATRKAMHERVQAESAATDRRETRAYYEKVARDSEAESALWAQMIKSATEGYLYMPRGGGGFQWFRDNTELISAAVAMGRVVYEARPAGA